MGVKRAVGKVETGFAVRANVSSRSGKKAEGDGDLEHVGSLQARRRKSSVGHGRT